MTLPEKVGQMTQLDITLINTTGKQKDVAFDAEKAKKLLREHHIGSFLNGEADDPLKWYNFSNELTKIALEESRLGIPIIYGIDHIHGANYLRNSTIFPHNINIAASFNPENAHYSGWVTAYETADIGHHWIFAPILDICVNPLWARFYETFGEDPHLAGIMGASFTKGIQNNTKTAPYKQAATGKHFLGYSDPRSGWDRTPVSLSMQQIQEFHRPAFQKAIDAGLKTIMLNSGEINGTPVHASEELIEGLLREQMGFDGVVVTDWDDIGKLVDFHYTAKNYKEATYDAVKAGIDVCMTPLHLKFNAALLELVKEGRISEERIDKSVRRILKLKFELGLFEHPYPRKDRLTRICERENKEKAFNAAAESIVLLKNDKEILPLSSPKKVGVFGISANSRRNLSGGWTLAWQGAQEEEYPDDMDTLFTALEKEFPNTEFILFNDTQIPIPPTSTQSECTAFLEQISTFDVLIYAGGEEPYSEFAGNINDLKLPEEQTKQISFFSEANTPLILILIEGRPRLISSIADKVQAILFAGLPGFEGAKAISQILSGTINPSGKLPFTYPISPNHHVTYNHKRSNIYSFDVAHANYIEQANKSAWLYPFGHGLSYTNFEYSNLRLSKKSIESGESLDAIITVTNSGNKSGWETALWFTSTHFGKITRPIKELKHFSRIHLNPGESAECTFTISYDTLTYPDANGHKVHEPGTHSVLIGNLRADFETM